MRLHKQRGMTLLEVSLATSLAIVFILSLFPLYKTYVVDKASIRISAERYKTIYDAVLRFRSDTTGWPVSIATLTTGSYLPATSATTAWGGSYSLSSSGNNIQITVPTPEVKFAEGVLAYMANGVISGTNVTDTLVPPGQEASNAALYARDGSNGPLLANMNANGFDITGLNNVTTSTLTLGGTALDNADAVVLDALTSMSNCPTGSYITKSAGAFICQMASSSPSGMVAPFSQTTCPAGWADYTAADGRFVVGTGGGYSLGATGGANTVALTTAQMPSHKHDSGVTVRTSSGGQNTPYGYIRYNTNTWEHHKNYYGIQGRPYTSSVGSNQGHENRPPYIALKWCRKS